ncbi:MAG TPA: MFS transporter [Solirubrobacteraceae bacterium]|jgi:EmrB/QacA subfamily drug resistance transporter|nr:MFS transporter [Solirubrobacteraceae bacterium]
MSPQEQMKRHLRATLILACLAQFMVILDVSVVNVALPSIRRALGFTLSDLQWVVNAYTVTFAGFLLLGGRAADLLGRRRVFVVGLVLFALASLGGGLANSQAVLIIMRLIQGLGGAVIAPASLSIITSTFTEPSERNRAVGMWGAMGGAGGAAGVLLGGVLTDLLSWRWILFINLPIGLIAAFLAQRMISEGRNPNAARGFDFGGALSATAGLSLLVLGIVRTDTTGWGNSTTLAFMLAGVALLGLFVAIEGRFAKAPLMPLRLFANRSLTTGNLIMMLVGGSTFAMWFFFSLYLQDVRGYSPLHAGLIFLPMTVLIVIGSTIASRITLRVGAKRLLVAGMVGLAVGLFLFAQLNPTGSYLGDMLAPSLLTSIAMPFAFIPATISATAGVPRHEAGLASGVINTSRMFGGALGLAILATLASTQTKNDLHHPTAALHTASQALTNGFHLAFLVGAGMAAVGAVIAAVGMPSLKARTAEVPAQTAEAPESQQVAVEV